MSADGSVVVFEVSPAAAETDVYVWVRGQATSHLLTPGPSVGWGPVVSADGSTVAFTSPSSELGTTGGIPQSFAYDRASGSLEQLTTSSSAVGPASLSSTGRYVVVGTDAMLTAEDDDQLTDGYLIDRQLNQIRLVTAGIGGHVYPLRVSADGARVGLVTWPVGTIQPTDSDALVRDLVAGKTTTAFQGTDLTIVFSEDLQLALGKSYFSGPSLRWEAASRSITEIDNFEAISRNGRYVVIDSAGSGSHIWDLGPS